MGSDSFLAGLAPEIIGTIVTVSVVILANIFITDALRGRGWLSRETKLRASVFWRNFSFLIGFVAMLFIWRAELRAAALSFAALTVALVSLLAGKPVRSDVAMTGEISLRGLVLPIGGVKEKVLAALRTGIKTVMLPKRNQKDLEDVPAAAREKLEFVWLETVEDAVRCATGVEPGQLFKSKAEE